MTPDTDALLDVDGLTVAFRGPKHAVRAVDNVSFRVGVEKVGIVGESGSGKSTVGRAILRLLPRNAQVHARAIGFGSRNLLTLSERQMRDIRGSQIGMILQDPKYSLNPVVKVGEQIAEVMRLRDVGRAQARRKTLAMLEAVHIREPERVYELYPHQVSGGMGQRIMIAAMLVADPKLLIADEPTSALDVTVRMEVLRLLDELTISRGLGLIFISHDLNLVRSFCDRVIVMYAGRIVEAIAADALEQARHPYTRGLLEAMPCIHAPRRRLPVLERDASWHEQPGIIAR